MKSILVIVLLFFFSCSKDEKEVQHGVLEQSVPSSCGGFSSTVRTAGSDHISRFKPDSVSLEAFYGSAEVYWKFENGTVELLVLNQKFNCAAMPVMSCDRVNTLYTLSFRDLNTGDMASCKCPYDFYASFSDVEGDGISIQLNSEVYTIDLTKMCGSFGEGSGTLIHALPHEIVLDNFDGEGYDASLSTLGNEFLSYLTAEYGYPGFTLASGGFWDAFNIYRGVVFSVDHTTGDTTIFASDSIADEVTAQKINLTEFGKMFNNGKLDVQICSEKGYEDSAPRFPAVVAMDFPGDYRALKEGDFSDQKSVTLDNSTYNVGWNISKATYLHIRGRFKGEFSVVLMGMDSDSNAVFLTSPLKIDGTEPEVVDTLIPLSSFTSDYSDNYESALTSISGLLFNVSISGSEVASISLSRLSLIYPSYIDAKESFSFSEPKEFRLK